MKFVFTNMDQNLILDQHNVDICKTVRETELKVDLSHLFRKNII